MHDLLLEDEGDVGAAVVLVRGAGVAFDSRLREAGAPALAELQAGFHKAVGFSNGHAALIWGASPSALGAEFA